MNTNPSKKPLLDYLRDPLISGLLIGVAAIVVTIIISLYQRQTKVISYEIVTNSSITYIKEGYESKLQLLYDGKPINELRLVEIRFSNTGNMPIDSSDFKDDLYIYFSDKAEILSSPEIIAIEPLELSKFIQVQSTQNNIVAIKPFPFTQGHSFTLQFLLSGSNGDIKVSSYILGGQVKELNNRKTATVLVGIAGLIAIMSLSGVSILTSLRAPIQNKEVVIRSVKILKIISYFALFAMISIMFFYEPDTAISRMASLMFR